MHSTDTVHRHLARALQAMTGDKYARCLQAVRDTAEGTAARRIEEAVRHIDANAGSAGRLAGTRPYDPDVHPVPADRSHGLAWTVGAAADGRLVIDRFDTPDGHARPHLFIAGASGSGRTNTLALMLDQLTRTHTPDRLRISLIGPHDHDPAIDTAHVTHTWTARTDGFADNPYTPIADHLAELVAQTRSHNNGNPAGHTRLVVIDECHAVFGRPRHSDHLNDWERLHGHVGELARTSAIAHVRIVTVTRYPKKENVPTGLLAASRRLGFGMNRVGSLLTVESMDLHYYADFGDPGTARHVDHDGTTTDVKVLHTGAQPTAAPVAHD